VYDSDEDPDANAEIFNPEGDEEYTDASDEADESDEEEVADKVVKEAITTPSTGSGKRKVLNFVSISPTPSKSKHIYYIFTYAFLLTSDFRAEA